MKFIKNKLNKCLVIVLVTLMLFNYWVPNVANASLLDSTIDDLKDVMSEQTESFIEKLLYGLAEIIYLFIWTGTGCVNMVLGGIINSYYLELEGMESIFDFFRLTSEFPTIEEVKPIEELLFIGPDTIFEGKVTVLNANIFKSIANDPYDILNILDEMKAELEEMESDIKMEEISILSYNAAFDNGWNEHFDFYNFLRLMSRFYQNGTGILKSSEFDFSEEERNVLNTYKNNESQLDDNYLYKIAVSISNTIEGYIEKDEKNAQTISVYDTYLGKIQNSKNEINTLYEEETLRANNPANFMMSKVGRAVAKLYVYLRNIAALIMLAGLIFTGIKILINSNNPESKRCSTNIPKRLGNGDGASNIFTYNYDINI